MTLDEEFQHVPKLTNCARALVDFVGSLAKGEFERKGGGWWVYGPASFVAFRVQYIRKKNVVISLYGSVWQWRKAKKESPCLPIKRGRHSSWIECALDGPAQIAAALAYVEEACTLKNGHEPPGS